MVTCFLCNQTFDSIKILFNHFNFFHPEQKFDSYFCAENNCSRSFSLKNSFRKHLLKHTYESQPCTAPQLNDTYSFIDAITNTNVITEVGYTHSNSEFNGNCKDNLTIDPVELLNHSISCFLASLYANPIIPRNAVQVVVDGLEKVIVEGFSAYIENYIKKMLSEKKISSECFTVVDNITSVIKNALGNFKTEHKRFNFFAEKGTYIEPKEVVIGQRLNKIIKNGVSILEPINCSQQFIPLSKVLKQFFSLENILGETLENMTNLMSNKSVLGNFIQGTFWQSRIKKFEGKTVLPLFLFFDDFESGNVLGSHSGIHKLGAVYVSLPCIPLHRSSMLSNIFLTLLFHSSDRVEFGNNVIFKPVIDELNFLQNVGIEIDTSVFKGTLYFDLGLILGDNLGLHSIIGFVESFSSNFPCRICNIRKENLRVQCYEDESLLRTIDQYYIHLNENNVSTTGIKEKCVWLDVNNFSLYDQVGVDVMHDVLEGCAKYIMGFIIYYYINELKLFSLQVFNERLFGFDFGPERNKPCALTMEHVSQGNVRQSASEMLILVRYFGLIIGDFIPAEEPVWALYILLRKVIDIMLSSLVEEQSTFLLKTLVEELNELYLKYSKKSLKPKFHFLLHYPSLIKKFGPVGNFWSMRFEAKHRISKIAARSSFNRRNICLTLAIKHQLQLNDIFGKGKLCSNVVVGPCKSLCPMKSHAIKNELNLDLDKSLFCVSWATIEGIRYKIKHILTQDILEDNNYKFVSVNNIFLYDSNRIIFECNSLLMVGFNEHVYSYEVIFPETNNNCFIFQDSLVSPIPNNLNVTPDGTKFVTVRSPL
ncbi:unnamed protein product [Macrosiphum euphorbiae]|uniref:C2H2-type domain-containing protein n=1 Tax=Macrosiphum euphorbiae TaxID=13131 RepID=A0AAV0XV14_9HEMI|nr:unnamed protein product [Macrosiphum euphorbiae]